MEDLGLTLGASTFGALPDYKAARSAEKPCSYGFAYGACSVTV